MQKLLTATAALALTAGTAAADGHAAYTLHILHYNDTHSRIEPINRFDSTCSAEDDAAGECFGGSARLKAAIDMKREELAGENVIVLDAGDQLQGSLMFTTYNGDAEAEMVNAIAPDVMAVGNHEFNKGDENLARVIDLLEMPVVSGNLDLTGNNVLGGKIEDTLVLEVGGERIGIVSALATDTAETSSPSDQVVFMDEAESLAQDVATLTDDGVNKIIALTHVGFPADQRIAGAGIDGLDVIVGGHSHTVFSNTEEGAEAYPTMEGDVPIVQAGAYTKYLGHLTVSFDADGNVIDATGDTMLLDASVEPDAELAARVAELAAPIQEMQQEVVGQSAGFIEGDRSVCRVMECPMGNLVADAMLDRVKDQGVTIAIQNGGGLRASIDEGDITMGEIVTVLPFQNTLATFELTGAEVIEALENGVSEVEEGAGRFPQVSGITYKADLTAEPGSRITSVMIDGAEIDPEATYGVVSNNYMRGGGDGYSVFEGARNAYDYGPGLEQVVIDYIAAQGGAYAPYTDGRIDVGG
ncbi:5'-nucleotidase C-terminal domain-containing protein [Jannaschia sp. Os4]|uniref:bifunctional metallophosphatase/5'-nucleotidase n=1 Tax=Jannaschia sp. Os4 TaxID=2807617 RepID=UPI0019392E39|nr:5'-nucleotidase C-terminal domain-containing protein [Jannaschia sp. Os4]MBM2574682.1 5'-nucleotidase C-terminal domain-containing protein [Jannaschia sp. Os4]